MPDVLLTAHVGLGTIAVLAGAGALFTRKGQRFHVRAGRVFAIAMLASSLLGALLGALTPDPFYITLHAGVLGATLIASGWLAARRRDGRWNRAAASLALLNALNAGALIFAGTSAAGTAHGTLFAFPAEDYFFLAGMALLATAGDLHAWWRGALARHHQIARHLWRLCLGFFIAAGSAFTGPGRVVFPDAVQASGALALPELIILLLLLYWLVRTLRSEAPTSS